MWFFAIILYLIFRFLFWGSIFALLLPVIGGLIIIGLGNHICETTLNKKAPIWWVVLSGAVTVYSTVSFWKYIFSNETESPPIPLIILLVYGIISVLLLAASAHIKQDIDNSNAANKYNAKRTPKRSYNSANASNQNKTASSAKNNAAAQSKSVSEILDITEELYSDYVEVWSDDENRLMLEDLALAISTYPNADLPLPEIMRQTAMSYTAQMEKLLPLTGSLESYVYQLSNRTSFTEDDLERISALYDNFSSNIDSLRENYHSLTDMTHSLKTQMGITNTSVINANKVLTAALEAYCTDYKTMLSSLSAASKNLYTILKSNSAEVSKQTDYGSFSASPRPSRKSPLLSRVRKNLTVDSSIFDRYGMTFKCHLIEDFGTLQLNYEISDTSLFIKHTPKGTELTIKANVYDADNNLLCIEETWVDYGELKSGYSADFLYFSNDAMATANSMRVYAIDPIDEEYEAEEEEDEESFTGTSDELDLFFVNESLAARANENLSAALKQLETTLSPGTFFSKYNEALTNAEKIISATHSDSHKAYAQEIIDNLKNNRDEKIIEFVDRCNRKGKLCLIKDELLSGRYDISSAVIAHINELLAEIDAKAEDAPASGEYIYCSLSFSTNGKTYYYKTTDETLKCGDEVIVPTGNNGRKGIAKIEKIEKFKIGETPYPPALTKSILGKCEY